jgi:hypothetical protein
MGSSTETKYVPTTTTGSTEPWGPAQGPLNTALQGAQSLYASDVGYKPYTGQMQAGLSSQTQGALDQTQQLAQGQGGLLGQAGYGYATDLVNSGGMSADQRASLAPLQATANGDYLNQTNPYLQQMLDTNAEKVRNQVNSSMSGAGRYGSGAHTTQLSKGITDATAPLLYQNYDAERQRQLSAATGLSDIYGQASNRALQTAGMGASLTDQLYDPASRMAGVGQVYDDRAQTDINNQISQWDAAQARPWEQLSRLNAIASGSGQLGGTSTKTTPVAQQSTLQKILGYGATGLGLLGSL